MDKELIDYKFEKDKELAELEKQAKLEVAKYYRDTERMKHELELERLRIKSAEIRKSQFRRQ